MDLFDSRVCRCKSFNNTKSIKTLASPSSALLKFQLEIETNIDLFTVIGRSEMMFKRHVNEALLKHKPNFQNSERI